MGRDCQARVGMTVKLTEQALERRAENGRSDPSKGGTGVIVKCHPNWTCDVMWCAFHARPDVHDKTHDACTDVAYLLTPHHAWHQAQHKTGSRGLRMWDSCGERHSMYHYRGAAVRSALDVPRGACCRAVLALFGLVDCPL